MRQPAYVVIISLALAGSVVAQQIEYQGPTILSRGVGPVLQGGGDVIRLRPFVTVTGSYDTGLTPVSVDEEGRIPQFDSYGVQVSGGVTGYHTWRHTVLGLDYRGNGAHYTQHHYYDGTNHNLSLGMTHQPSRSMIVTLRESAGTYSRNYGEPLTAGGFYDPNFSGVPSNELFDGRVYYASTMGDMTLLKGRRLSFNMGGTGLVVRRRSQSLIGVTGWLARGDVSYRLNRTNTIGADYGYTHYDYTHSFGASDVHSVAFDYAARFGRRWDFGIRFGAHRVESLGLRVVAIDPIVAAILGRTTGVETYYRVNYVPNLTARLSRTFRRSSISFDYFRGVNPGNGIYLTSQYQDVGARLSITATSRWNFGLSGSYSTYSSLSQQIGKYQDYRAAIGANCRLTRFLHAVSRFEYRNYEVGGTPFQRNSYAASAGMAFSPGDFPLSLW